MAKIIKGKLCLNKLELELVISAFANDQDHHIGVDEEWEEGGAKDKFLKELYDLKEIKCI